MESERVLLEFKTFLILFLSLHINLSGVLGDNGEAQKYLELGKKFLQEGSMSEALEQYSLAVEADKNNYLTYFKRATIYLALGQSRKSLPDFNRAIELKPDFHQGYLQRANTNLKMGNVKEARNDYKYLISSENSATEEAKLQLERSEHTELAMSEIDRLQVPNDCQQQVELLNMVVEVCPWNVRFREKRAVCNEAMGQYQSAISDIKMTTKLVPDNTEGFFKASQLYYLLGEEEDSLKEIRDCLRLDPDSKTCFPFYKKVKKLSKQLKNAQSAIDEGKFEEAIDKLTSALSTEGEVVAFVKRIEGHFCHCYSKLGNVEEGMAWCNKVLERDESDVDAVCNKAELHIGRQEYEEAIKIYQKANNQDRRIKEGLDRAQRLLKQSKKRDYYKILDVPRTATTKEINKAYRTLAKQWHPDKFESEEEKNEAEKKFYEIAAAKEVLTDKEMRQKFDNGEDPLDPEQQHGGGHHGFPHGFNPFGGGFTFKFNF